MPLLLRPMRLILTPNWSLVAAKKKAEANHKKPEKIKAKKRAEKAALEVKQLNADETLLAPPERMDVWFAAYQQAFAKEHEWLEARNH